MIELSVVDHPVEPPPGVVAVVPEALVPMLWWRGVVMCKHEPVTMTPLERFSLDLALTMGRAEPHELLEITGLPGALLPVAARRLVRSGILVQAGDGFVPNRPAAEQAASTQTIYEQRHTSLDVVLLPRTGDVLALDPDSSGLRGVEQLRPQSVGNAPVPSSMTDVNLADYLRGRLRDGSLAGVGSEITDVARDAGEYPTVSRRGWCPVYRARAEVRRDGERHLPVVALPGARDREPVTLALPGADGLARDWLKLAGTFDEQAGRAQAWDAVMGWEEGIAPRAQRTGPGRWTFFLSGTAGRELCSRGRNLALPLGMAVRSEDAVVELTVDLAGADGPAQELVELDRVLTAAAEPGADVAAVPGTDDARARAWQLGFPALVYALREAADFSYD